MAKSDRKSILADLLDSGTAKAERQKSETWIKENIVVREELKNLIPPLTSEEFNRLYWSIFKEGCRDSLILWNDKSINEYVLIDGHNRYQICRKDKLDFQIEIKDFNNLQEVKNWMIDNQLGKRNVADNVKSYLRGQQYLLERHEVGGTGANQHNSKGEKSSPLQNQGKTAERLARRYKVSDKTIKNDKKYTESVDKLSAGDSDLKWQILNKEIDIPKGALIDLGKEEDKGKLEGIKKGLIAKKAFKEVLKELEAPAPKKTPQELTPEEQLEKEKKRLRTLLKKGLESGLTIEDIQSLVDELR